MESNRERLLRLASEARSERRLGRQIDLIKATGLSKSTIGRFEKGESIDETSLRAISRAIGWTADSGAEVLAGGDPTPASAPAQTQQVVREGDMDPDKPLAERLPTSIMHALEGREIYATDTYDLTLDGGLMLVAVVVRDPDDPGHPKDFDRVRRDNRAWLRAQRQLRNLPPPEWEPGDPEEWKEDSGTNNPE